MRTDKSDWTAKVNFGDPNILPRCAPRALDVHSKIPRCRISCSAARIPSACFMPRVSAEHKGAYEGTSLSVHDPSNRYKPVHVPLDDDFCPCFYMVRPCSSFQALDWCTTHQVGSPVAHTWSSWLRSEEAWNILNYKFYCTTVIRFRNLSSRPPMSSYPARIPASVFANPNCQTPSFKTKTFTPPRPTYTSPSPYPPKSRIYSNASDDVYVPRSSAFMSIGYLREAITTIVLE